jgi:hypothetical protein
VPCTVSPALCPLHADPGLLLSLFISQTKDFDLILGVSPDASKEYGGRHITIAHVTAKSEAAAADVLRKCKHVLAEWSMRGSTSLGSMAGPACLGHMSPGATTCSDNKEWQIE